MQFLLKNKPPINLFYVSLFEKAKKNKQTNLQVWRIAQSDPMDWAQKTIPTLCLFYVGADTRLAN